ncbi:major facilitator superfamily domain-containing protein [Scleroderma yunnanense]
MAQTNEPPTTSIPVAIEVKSIHWPAESSGDGCTSSKASDPENQPSPAQRRRANIQLVALCWTTFVIGWNDGTTGPLLPRAQRVYGGFLIGALSNLVLDPRYGFGKVIVLGTLFPVVGYAINASAPPFPVFILGYAINGVGMALLDAQANGFVASLRDNPETKMGILHAAYGIPIFLHAALANFGVRRRRTIFPTHIHTVRSTSALVIPLSHFLRLKTQDECLTQIGLPPGEKGTSESSQIRQVFSLKVVHLLALFILVYVGVEVTTAGWTVTYIINIRGGGPSSGYISSGFYAGLMIGRVALLWVNQKFIVWFVPSLIAGAVSTSIIGILLGPMYPIAMNHAGRILPRWLLTGSIGWIAGCGQAGSALLPFMTGAIASKSGIGALQPFHGCRLVSMMAFMTFIWAIVPNSAQKG